MFGSHLDPNGYLTNPVANVACRLRAYVDLTDRTHMSAAKLNLRKLYLFHTTLDEYDFYMKIVALNEIYNFLVLTF